MLVTLSRSHFVPCTALRCAALHLAWVQLRCDPDHLLSFRPMFLPMRLLGTSYSCRLGRCAPQPRHTGPETFGCLRAQDASNDELAEAKDAAASAVADFARFQDVFQFDLADSPAIQQLENDPKFAPLYQLLQMVLQGDVKVRQIAMSRHCVHKCC